MLIALLFALALRMSDNACSIVYQSDGTCMRLKPQLTTNPDRRTHWLLEVGSALVNATIESALGRASVVS